MGVLESRCIAQLQVLCDLVSAYRYQEKQPRLRSRREVSSWSFPRVRIWGLYCKGCSKTVLLVVENQLPPLRYGKQFVNAKPDDLVSAGFIIIFIC